MIWERGDAPLRAGQAMSFHFRIEDATGAPASDMEPYMGMAGHAEFVRADFTVFAHVHPAGSVSMAAMELAQRSLPEGGVAAPLGAHAGMVMPDERVAPDISFPYGFPQPGATASSCR